MAKEKLTILSSTLAEIYVRQGHFEKAREVYEKLLSKDRGNDQYRSRLLLLSKDSPEKRKLLQFRYWHDLSYGEISKIMGISERAVEGQLYRAKHEFAKAWASLNRTV